MSVRTRLTLWNVGILTLLLLGMGLILRVRVMAQWERALDAELMRRTHWIPPKEHFKPFKPSEKDASAKVPFFYPDGRPIVGDMVPVDPEAIPQALKTRQDIFSTRGVDRVLTHPGEFSDGTGFAFQTSESMTPMLRDVASLTRELLLLLPLGILAAGVGGLFLTARALHPVRAIAEATNSMDATDLSRRLPESGKDEFAQLTQTLNKMLGRLEDAFTRQRRFVADASHELKTPLTIVSGAAQLGLTDDSASPAARQLFGRINDASERMGKLVGGLLELARGNGESGTAHFGPVPLEPLLCAAAEEARLLHPHGASVELQVEPEAMALGDAEALLRLLLNLLDNALRHTPGIGSVVAGAEPIDDEYRLFVRDTGPGIAADVLPRLGEPFYRPDAARTRQDGGSGLGLAICKQIAERHGSTLVIESKPGEGTTVSLWLKQAGHGVE